MREVSALWGRQAQMRHHPHGHVWKGANVHEPVCVHSVGVGAGCLHAKMCAWQAAQTPLEPTRVKWWVSLVDEPTELQGPAMDGVWGNARSWRDPPDGPVQAHGGGGGSSMGGA